MPQQQPEMQLALQVAAGMQVTSVTQLASQVYTAWEMPPATRRKALASRLLSVSLVSLIVLSDLFLMATSQSRTSSVSGNTAGATPDLGRYGALGYSLR